MNEPTTVLTDYLVAGFAVVFLARLFRMYRETRSISVLFWGLAFGAVALGAVLGGTFHGTRGRWGTPVEEGLWLATLVALLAVSFLLLMAVIFSSLEGTWRRVAVSVAAGKAVLFLLWILDDPRFLVAICDYGSSMAGASVLAAFRLGGGWKKPGRWILSAVAVSALGATVQALKWAPHPSFNHNDVFHVIQLGANWLFFRGALLSRDRRGAGWTRRNRDLS